MPDFFISSIKIHFVFKIVSLVITLIDFWPESVRLSLIKFFLIQRSAYECIFIKDFLVKMLCQLKLIGHSNDSIRFDY